MPKYKFSEIAYNINQKRIPEPGDEEMYIGLEHLDSGSLKVRRWGSDVPITGEKLVMEKGDLLFGRRNTYLRRAAIAPYNGLFSAHGMIFRPNTDVMDPDYFPFFISSDYFMNAAIRISVGSLSPTVNWKTLKDLEFDVPDLISQHRSAELLSAANELKEAYEALLIQTDELVKAQFIELFYQQGYPDVPIGSVLKQTLKTEKIVNTLSEKYVTVALHGNGARERNIDIHDPKPFSAYRIKAGQFIYSRIDARNGAFSIVPEDLDGAVVSKDFPVFDIDTGRIMPQVLMFSVLSDNFIQQIKQNSLGTTNRQRIKEDVFLKYHIVIPPLSVQRQFEELVEQSEKTKLGVQKSIDGISELIKSLLQQDFTN